MGSRDAAIRATVEHLARRMHVYVNLPVADLHRSREYFESLGFKADERFSDETALALKISEGIYAMLLTHGKFSEFTPKPIADAATSTEVLVCLQVESRDEVDQYVGAAVASGGTEFREPQDHGFMYGRSFADLDGHIWEFVYMDWTHAPEGFDAMELQTRPSEDPAKA